jgi:hypothetical protein
LGVRWTVGDVSRRGFESLALSVHGAIQIFGPSAAYAICVNTLSIDETRNRTGPLPPLVTWIEANADIPAFLKPHLDDGLAEGVAWKLAPLRVFPDRHELSFDNDCILWSLPPAVAAWLDDPSSCLLAADVIPALGRFGAVVGPRALNTGIRGLPPGFDLGAALAATLSAHPGPLASELDEQGLQVAALLDHPLHIVDLADVQICSPFPPHAQQPGRCGAHFVGLNVRRERPYCDAATLAQIAAFWDERVATIQAKVRLGALPLDPAKGEPLEPIT